jgi:type IV secretion system protein VirB4
MALRNEKALRRETGAAAMIPITAHVDEHVARTQSGDYVQALRLSGASFESADDEDINGWHERLNILWRNIASPNLALWTHVVRRRETDRTSRHCEPGFAADLHTKYQQKIAGQTLMVNELYLSLVYRPQPTAVGAAMLKLLRRADREAGHVELHDALDECAKKRQELMASLTRYDPEPLGIYRGPGGRLFSSLIEFYAFLVNGEWQRMPLPRAPLNEVLATTRPFFGHEAMEYRTTVQTRLGAFLGIKEYPTPTVPGIFDGLLTAPYPFVLTQSFGFLPKPGAVDLMTRQYKRLCAAGDLAVSQAEELKDALDDLSSGRFVVGDHHFTLHVLADPFDGVKEAETAARLKHLNDHIASARFTLAESGMVVAREDLALEAAFWAQLPGNFRYRPRKAPITSRNFAAMAPFHNYPSGRASGNHWGEALTMFVTNALSPYFFSLHASDPRASDGGSRKDVGHIAGIGPVGTGKTTLLGFLIAMLTGFDVKQVVFDKDEGLHILVRALGGTYLPLKNGRSTGCNPLQLPAVPDTMEFLKHWLRRLVMRSADETLTVRQEEDLDQALRGTLQLDRSARRLSRVLEFLDPTDPEGVHARLKKWCAKEGGDYASVFDNASDEIVPVLDESDIVGFDVTDFLDNPTVRDPLSMYLFHLVRRMVDGRRMVVWADEFARLLADPSFADFSRNGLETWRKKEASLAAFTQSASHVLNSSIARAIVEQTPTKIFFPNPDADYAEYTEGFSLTDREFQLIKQELEPGSRSFLIKQNHVSVVARLDLQGFDFELDVISGRTANVELMKHVIAQHGPDPQAWLPRFRDALARNKQVTATATSPTEASHA